jgi:hypothetical protein
MNIVPLILQIFAVIFLFFAAFNLFTGPAPKPLWGWFGMALWLLSLMVNGITLHATAGVH